MVSRITVNNFWQKSFFEITEEVAYKMKRAEGHLRDRFKVQKIDTCVYDLDVAEDGKAVFTLKMYPNFEECSWT